MVIQRAEKHEESGAELVASVPLPTLPPLPNFRGALDSIRKELGGKGQLGSEKNPATMRQLLEDRKLIKPGTYYLDEGQTKKMQANDVQATVDYLAGRLKQTEGTVIPEGSKLNPASSAYLLRKFDNFAAKIRNGQDVFFYLPEDPTNVREVTSNNPEAVRSFLAQKETQRAIKSFAVTETLRNRHATGYSQEDGWLSKNAARHWLWNEVGTFENALDQIKRGVPLHQVTPVMVAQSMHDLPLKYPQELLLEVTKGKYAGTVVPAVVIDCGDFGGNKYDIYTRSNKTAYALNPDGPSINLHLLPDGTLFGGKK